MNIVYAGEPLPDVIDVGSIFLAGPLPRADKPLQTAAIWRAVAIEELRRQGFEGHVFTPERRQATVLHSYNDQRLWELSAMARADVILFWLTRSVHVLGLTTNTEFGKYIHFGPSRIVVGTPSSANWRVHTRYQCELASDHCVSTMTGIPRTIGAAIELIGEGARRVGGETMVPLCIWRTDSFQSWYAAQTAAGQRLDGFELEHTVCVGPNRDIVFFWTAWVEWWIEREQRHKSNEWVITRPDISCVVLLYKDGDGEVFAVMVEEFRSPARTKSGFILEVPGGSTLKPEHADTTAVTELYEETGINIDPARLVALKPRQLAGTTTTHHAHVLAGVITSEEMHTVRRRHHEYFGNAEDGERTYVSIRRVSDLYKDPTTDWSTLGMINAARVALKL